MAIRTQHFLYHLTSVDNIPSIFHHGLLPRAAIENFRDIADPDIIEERRVRELDQYVPFHWFAKNPFDGRVHRDRPNEQFVLIAVSRAVAERDNWQVIARHPLAGGAFDLLDYAEGVDIIDWETMDRRDYTDPVCKQICMAECLSPVPVPVDTFAKIFAPSEGVLNTVRAHAIESEHPGLWIDENANMFPPR